MVDIVDSRTVRRGDLWTCRAREVAAAVHAGETRVGLKAGAETGAGTGAEAEAGAEADAGAAAAAGKARCARGGQLAPCGGSATARPSGGRALVRSRLCAPFALHCKYHSLYS